jgi:hypothetical protein
MPVRKRMHATAPALPSFNPTKANRPVRLLPRIGNQHLSNPALPLSTHVQVHILEPSGTAISCTVQLPSPPVFLAVSGLRAVDYRVVAACRNGHLYTVKNGELSATVIELEAMPSGKRLTPPAQLLFPLPLARPT